MHSVSGGYSATDTFLADRIDAIRQMICQGSETLGPGFGLGLKAKIFGLALGLADQGLGLATEVLGLELETYAYVVRYVIFFNG